jgi:2-iminobutanoate/2-iminopropanoate deaminase
MGSKTVVAASRAPKAIEPHNHAVISGNLLFTSGQLPIDPETGQLVDDGNEELAKQGIKNLAAMAKAAGANLQDTKKCAVFLTDMNGFKSVIQIYKTNFTSPFPASGAAQVAA